LRGNIGGAEACKVVIGVEGAIEACDRERVQVKEGPSFAEGGVGAGVRRKI
jgi:hypothetical protein